jgi:drug/metabolite transporter (DMT)-like permease
VEPELRRAHLLMHAAIVLWGFTGILGRVITLDALPLVWWRMLITVPMLFMLARIRGPVQWPDRADLLRISGVGVVIALHWLTFYGSIKLSNASVAASCLASTALFTAVAAPFIFRTRTRPSELILGLSAMAGIGLMFKFQGNQATGIAVGLISAALSGLFTIFNKVLLERHRPEVLLFIEITAGFVAVSILTPFLTEVSTFPVPDAHDVLWLFVLSAFCTVLPMQMSYRALRHVSPFLMNLSINLEPIYTMIVAAWLFGEHQELHAGFYAGTAVIIGSVALNGAMRTDMLQRNMARAKQKFSRTD